MHIPYFSPKIKFLRKALNLCKDYFGFAGIYLFHTILAVSIIALNLIQALLIPMLTLYFRNFYNLVKAVDVTYQLLLPAVAHFLGAGFVDALISTLTSACCNILEKSLAVVIKKDLIGRWMKHSNHYKLAQTISKYKNSTQQLLTVDADKYTHNLISMTESRSRVLFQFLVTCWALFTISGSLIVPIFGLSIAIPYIPIATIIYAYVYNYICSTPSNLIATHTNEYKQLHDSCYDKIDYIVANGKSIAFKNASEYEKASLARIIEAEFKALYKIRMYKYGLVFVKKFNVSVSEIVGILLALPQLVNKQIESSRIFEISTYFSKVVDFFTWGHQNSDNIASFNASIRRLMDFKKELIHLERDTRDIVYDIVPVSNEIKGDQVRIDVQGENIVYEVTNIKGNVIKHKLPLEERFNIAATIIADIYKNKDRKQTTKDAELLFKDFGYYEKQLGNLCKTINWLKEQNAQQKLIDAINKVLNVKLKLTDFTPDSNKLKHAINARYTHDGVQMLLEDACKITNNKSPLKSYHNQNIDPKPDITNKESLIAVFKRHFIKKESYKVDYIERFMQLIEQQLKSHLPKDVHPVEIYKSKQINNIISFAELGLTTYNVVPSYIEKAPNQIRVSIKDEYLVYSITNTNGSNVLHPTEKENEKNKSTINIPWKIKLSELGLTSKDALDPNLLNKTDIKAKILAITLKRGHTTTLSNDNILNQPDIKKKILKTTFHKNHTKNKLQRLEGHVVKLLYEGTPPNVTKMKFNEIYVYRDGGATCFTTKNSLEPIRFLDPDPNKDPKSIEETLYQKIKEIITTKAKLPTKTQSEIVTLALKYGIASNNTRWIDLLVYNNAGEVIIKDGNMPFEAGKSYLIAGENGVGKSTLINCLAGFATKASGTFILPKESYFIPQFPHLSAKTILNEDGTHHRLSLLEMIYYPIQIKDGKRESAKKEIAKCMRALHLREELIASLDEPFIENRILSGGEQQKIQIIQAIVKKPKILIMDEATASMADGESERVHSLLRDKLKGLIIIYTDHAIPYKEIINKKIIDPLCHAVLEIIDGSIKWSGFEARRLQSPFNKKNIYSYIPIYNNSTILKKGERGLSLDNNNKLKCHIGSSSYELKMGKDSSQPITKALYNKIKAVLEDKGKNFKLTPAEITEISDFITSKYPIPSKKSISRTSPAQMGRKETNNRDWTRLENIELATEQAQNPNGRSLFIKPVGACSDYTPPSLLRSSSSPSLAAIAATFNYPSISLLSPIHEAETPSGGSSPATGMSPRTSAPPSPVLSISPRISPPSITAFSLLSAHKSNHESEHQH